jgi:transposase
MYSTDLTESRWQFIKKRLDKVGRKRKYSLRAIIDGIFYLLKTGCQWRMLPKSYPKWELVYYYYSKWAEDGTIDLILEGLRTKVRILKGQRGSPSLGIMDSQSVRSANNRALKGVDGNKKVKGRKRHIVIDKNSWLISVMVCVANIHDSKAAELLAKVLKENILSLKLIMRIKG